MKFGDGLTVRPIVVLWVIVPELPVSVMVAAPSFAVLLAVIVNIGAAAVALTTFTGFRLKDGVTPSGSPEAERLTLPVKPLVGLTVIVPVLLLP